MCLSKIDLRIPTWENGGGAIYVMEQELPERVQQWKKAGLSNGVKKLTTLITALRII